MTTAPPQEVTQLLLAWREGDEEALEKLVPLVYRELHRLAHRYMAGEHREVTLQATALVNEAYLRLVDSRSSQCILLEAALSFLGLGVRPPTPTWGGMLNEAQSPAVLASMPWLWTPPGIAIAVTVLAVNFIGDGLRDALDLRSVVS